MALMSTPEQTEADAPDFDSMTKAQLLEYAEEHGIEGVNSRMLKADILEVITNAHGDLPIST